MKIENGEDFLNVIPHGLPSGCGHLYSFPMCIDSENAWNGNDSKTRTFLSFLTSCFVSLTPGYLL